MYEVYLKGLSSVNLGADEFEILFGLDVHLLFEILALVMVVDGFDGLLEADGDEQTDADGGDVGPEVHAAPYVDARRALTRRSHESRANRPMPCSAPNSDR